MWLQCIELTALFGHQYRMDDQLQSQMWHILSARYLILHVAMDDLMWFGIQVGIVEFSTR